MLATERLQQLLDLIHTSSKEELIWMNGYLSGIVNRINPTAPIPGPATTVKKITLVFGTETGNSKRLAGQLALIAKKKGVVANIIGLDQYRITNLTKEEYFFIIISTHGEGEPPEAAKVFYDHIHNHEFSLPNLKYSVLALGDTSYPLYCKTGEDVDLRFKNFSATQIVPMQKCDVDYEEDATAWFNKVLDAIEVSVQAIPAVVKETIKKPAAKKNYKGAIITNINLNDKGSAKQTYHIEIATDERVEYEPGDALAIIPANRAEVVGRIISLTNTDGDQQIQTSKFTGKIRELLTSHLNICYLLSSTVKKYASITEQEIPDIRMDLVDLLRIYPVKSVEQFVEVVKILSPIAPRLYSIASSPGTHENEIHITVARNRFEAQDEQKYGLCSEFLGDQPLQSSIDFHIHRNRSFRLAPPEKDIIMIGPGTGVAPFRSFLFERNSTGASGKNWFFFGEQHFTTDFLYQTEMQQFVQTGTLTKIDLAFSRDQENKIYVQNRMLENAEQLYEWISAGAYVYISGTKHPMSKDVEETLINIIEVEGNKSKDEAKLFLDGLKSSGRYEKDVY